MRKHRLIATLLVAGGTVVQTRKFKPTNAVGNAFTAVDFFNGWAVDEIAILEISRDRSGVDRFIEIVEELSRRCFVPLSVGGKIEQAEDALRYVRVGADKAVVNTAASDRPELIAEIADAIGRQSLVVSIDARRDESMPSGYRVVVDCARRDTDRDALAWAQEAVERGAGELLVNAVENDGDKRGYDIDLMRIVSGGTRVPLIAMGGVGRWEHLVDGIRLGGADAVAAGNIFHYTEHSTKKAKEFLAAAGLPMRRSSFYKVALPRRPKYRPF
ncbi:MAG: imidazole glycerol phosphate synthase subunit HisF [Rhodospirillales bacterium]|nr:imidazole glycerol phosphate synthase subunit HisF [Rhodospirillales bacterium]